MLQFLEVKITASGVAQAFKSDTQFPVDSVIVVANEYNKGDVYISNSSTLTYSGGLTLTKGKEIDLPASDLSKLYVAGYQDDKLTVIFR